MTLRDGLLDLRPLRTPAFRRLWVSGLLPVVAGQMVVVAVLFQVWELTRSPVWTGLIGLARAVPLLVFSLVGGSLADAMDRRRLLVATKWGQTVAGLGLAWQALAGWDDLAVIFALVALQATVGALGGPAQRAAIPRVLAREEVSAGIALQHLGFQAAMLLGPALGGLMIGRWDVGAVYLVYAVATFASLYGVLRLPALPPMDSAARAGWRSMVEGLGFVMRRPVLRGSFATDLAATVLAMPIALFPLVNEARFGGSPETLGLFLSCIAVGGIGAGLASGLVTRADRPGPVQLVAAAVWGVALALFGVVGPLWLALVMLVVAGAADTVSVLSRAGMVQLATPDSHRGRVTAVESTIGIAGPDVGNVRAGLVAGATSAPFALVSGGLAAAVVVGWIAWRNGPLRTFRVSEHPER